VLSLGDRHVSRAANRGAVAVLLDLEAWNRVLTEWSHCTECWVGARRIELEFSLRQLFKLDCFFVFWWAMLGVFLRHILRQCACAFGNPLAFVFETVSQLFIQL